jgi:hypothetical protein
LKFFVCPTIMKLPHLVQHSVTAASSYVTSTWQFSSHSCLFLIIYIHREQI